MKSIMTILVASLVLGFNFSNANPINNTNNTNSLSNSDKAILFNGDANALLLDNEEMKNTQGEGFFLALLGAALTPVAVQFGDWVGKQLFK